MRAQDPLEEMNLGNDPIKRLTYDSAKVTKEFKERIVELLKEYKIVSLGITMKCRV